MLEGATIAVLLAQCLLTDYAIAGDLGGWQQLSANVINVGNSQLGYGSQAQDFSSLGGDGWHGQAMTLGHGHGWNQHGWQQHGWQEPQHDYHPYHSHQIPIAAHIEVSKPIAVPVIKNIGVPLAQPIGIPIPHIQAIGVPQPYPVHVPVAHPVAIPVIKTIATIVEKKVPFPIEKIVPVPIIKHVPINIEKHIPVAVEKHYPIHTPSFKHILHKSHGWDR